MHGVVRMVWGKEGLGDACGNSPGSSHHSAWHRKPVLFVLMCVAAIANGAIPGVAVEYAGGGGVSWENFVFQEGGKIFPGEN